MKANVSGRGGQPASLSDRIGEQVLDLIRDRQLRPGERLPSVKELSEHFSVATPTMREALRLLQMAGYLNIRHGSGIYVRDAASRLVLSNPYLGALDADTILSLLQARRLIEPPVVELSARNASDSALDALAELLAEARHHLQSGGRADESLGITNMRFHRAIAEASANAILAEVVYTLTEVHIKEQMVILDLYDNRVRDHEQHEAILAALCARDPALAKALMTEHLDDVIGVIESRLKNEGGEVGA